MLAFEKTEAENFLRLGSPLRLRFPDRNTFCR
jgi:hypothetical protein